MKTLELFSHPGCLSRESGIALIQKVLRGFPDIFFKEVNMFESVKKAQSLGVQISPTLVLNRKIVSIGIPDEIKLRSILTSEQEGALHA